MLRDMNWGCLSFLILFPAGIFIWAAGERRRRAALPPEELKNLEADEDFGSIDEKLECIFCHFTKCVRVRPLTGSLEELVSCETSARFEEWRHKPLVALLAPEEYLDPIELRKIKTVKAHCMNCGNSWEMFPPEEKANQ